MAKIGTDRIVESARPRPGSSPALWDFLITYTVHFEASEIGRHFEDSVKIWEEDISVDDKITPYAQKELFRATDFRVFRRKSFTALRDVLDTEIGDEEVYAWIWLRRSGSTGPAADEQRTPIKSIRP
ncbi:hypothetical protein AB0N09_43920 [Streptomyces erythrochromogenes]|uniref:hypothetical protein n=1 Tax=Streptomyces erythrochromogenes TaxID=285574 RepID=UPI00343F1DBC